MDSRWLEMAFCSVFLSGNSLTFPPIKKELKSAFIIRWRYSLRADAETKRQMIPLGGGKFTWKWCSRCRRGRFKTHTDFYLMGFCSSFRGRGADRRWRQLCCFLLSKWRTHLNNWRTFGFQMELVCWRWWRPTALRIKLSDEEWGEERSSWWKWSNETLDIVFTSNLSLFESIFTNTCGGRDWGRVFKLEKNDDFKLLIVKQKLFLIWKVYFFNLWLLKLI